MIVERPIRAVLTVAIGRVFQLGAAFLTLKLSTTLLSPSDLGRINQLASVATLLAAGLLLPIVAYFARGIVGWVRDGSYGRHFVQILVLFLLASCVLPLVGVAALRLAGALPDAPVWLAAVILGFYIAGFPAHNLMINASAFFAQRIRTTVYTNLAAWAGLALAVILFARTGDPWFWLLGTFAGYLISAQALWLLRSPPDGIRIAHEAVALPVNGRAIYAFVWPQVLMFLLWWTQSHSYRFILVSLGGFAQAGVFFACYTLVSVPMQAFEGAFNEIYSPTLFRGASSGRPEDVVRAWNRYVRAYVPSIVLFGLFLFGCAPFFARLALGSEFQVAGVFFVWPVVAETARALSSTNQMLGIAGVDMKKVLPPALAGAVLAPTLLLVLVPISPLHGAGLALCGAGLAVLAVAYRSTRKAGDVRWPWRPSAKAVALGSPMIVPASITPLFEPPTAGIAFAVCALLGVYVLGALYFLAREWLPHLRGANVGP